MDENNSESTAVYLHIYDISMGMAAQLSYNFLGKHIDGIWHTGIVYCGQEYFWDRTIAQNLPARTRFGNPAKKIYLGESFIPEEIFQSYLAEVAPRYQVEHYNLLNNNCNNFTSEVSLFLTGKDIPQEILNLPDDFLNTPLGAMLRPFIEQFENSMKNSMI